MPKRSLLERLLEPGGLRVAFQPIYALAGRETRLFAFEALTRGPAGSNLERADVLFEYVRRKGREALVDRACVKNALSALSGFAREASLSLNVHASTIEGDPGFARFLVDACQELSFPVTSVILEVVEQQPFSDGARFHRNVREIRDTGARIALDDVGVGYSNFRMMVEIRPEFYKVDRYFVHGSHTNAGTRAALRSIVGLARDLGGCVIAEGVERQEDLDAVLAAAVDLAQGYFLSRPLSAERLGDAVTGHVPEAPPADRPN